ncbi:unnamed protein product, partial [Ectocarpus sp. 4 AP-2014]
MIDSKIGARSFGGLLYDALMIHVKEEDQKKKLALLSGSFIATADAADTTTASAASPATSTATVSAQRYAPNLPRP